MTDTADKLNQIAALDLRVDAIPAHLLDTAKEGADLIKRLRKELTLLKVAFCDVFDGVDYAAAEGFEWPNDPVTPDVKNYIEKYCSATLKERR